MSNFNNKLAWNTISGYNGFLSTYYNGDIDIDKNKSMTGTADIVLRSGNIYTSTTAYINTMPIIKLSYLDVNSSIALQFSGLSGLIYNTLKQNYATIGYVDMSVSGMLYKVKQSEANADQSENNAKTYQDTSLKYLLTTSGYVYSCQKSDSNANTSEANAKTYQDNAKKSQDAAKVSEDAATTSKNAAAGSATEASGSATEASGSAGAAATSMGGALTQAEFSAGYASASAASAAIAVAASLITAIAGAAGATGAKGNQGDKGDKGDTGATGGTGAKGDTGANASLATNNAWTGTNSFSILPTSTVVPTTNDQFSNKKYVDDHISSGGGTQLLSATNTWTGSNTFNTNTTFNGNIRLKLDDTQSIYMTAVGGNAVSFRYYKFEIVQLASNVGCVQLTEFLIGYNSTKLDYTNVTATSNLSFSDVTQLPQSALDGNMATKWAAPFTLGTYTTFVVDFNTSRLVNCYTYTTGNDSWERDPKSFVFYGSNDSTFWVKLDTQLSFTTSGTRFYQLPWINFINQSTPKLNIAGGLITTGATTLNGDLTVVGETAFNASLPTSTIVTTTSNSFITKFIADGLYMAVLGFGTSFVTTNQTVQLGFNVYGTLGIGTNNIGIGLNCGQNVKGSYNLMLGTSNGQASNDSNTYNYSTAIGYNSTINSSNQIMLGSSAETVVCPNRLKVGSVQIGSLYGVYYSIGNKTAINFGSNYFLTNITLGAGIYNVNYRTTFGYQDGGTLYGTGMIYIIHGVGDSSIYPRNLDFNKFCGSPIANNTETYPRQQSTYFLTLTTSTVIWLNASVSNPAGTFTGNPALSGDISVVRIG